MNQLLRVGVIGAGVMGANHARVYSELADVELVGVADTNQDVAQEVASKYRTTAFSDLRDLLKQGLDAVTIAVPTSLHRDIAVEVAHAGVDMLVEKPIANTVNAAKDIITAAERNEVKLMVGHIERFNPVVLAIKAELADTDVVLIEISRIGPLPPRIKDVGVVIDLATHDIDLIRYITRSEVRRSYSLTSRNTFEKEDVAILLLEMGNGTLARVTVDWLTPFKVRDISIATRNNLIKGSLLDQTAATYSEYRKGVYTVRELDVHAGEPLKLEIAAFLESVRDNRETPVTGDDGLKALEVAAKCLEQTG